MLSKKSHNYESRLFFRHIFCHNLLMRHILTLAVLVTLLVPSLTQGKTAKFEDLVWRGSLQYKKNTDVPFSGEIRGKGWGRVQNGKRVGPWIWYHENGQIMYKGAYIDGIQDGRWIQYYSNGQLSSDGTYKDGKREGPWVLYNSNGQKYLKGDKFRQGSGTYKNGYKVN